MVVSVYVVQLICVHATSYISANLTYALDPCTYDDRISIPTHMLYMQLMQMQSLLICSAHRSVARMYVLLICISRIFIPAHVFDAIPAPCINVDVFTRHWLKHDSDIPLADL